MMTEGTRQRHPLHGFLIHPEEPPARSQRGFFAFGPPYDRAETAGR